MWLCEFFLFAASALLLFFCCPDVGIFDVRTFLLCLFFPSFSVGLLFRAFMAACFSFARSRDCCFFGLFGFGWAWFCFFGCTCLGFCYCFVVRGVLWRFCDIFEVVGWRVFFSFFVCLCVFVAFVVSVFWVLLVRFFLYVCFVCPMLLFSRLVRAFLSLVWCV